MFGLIFSYTGHFLNTLFLFFSFPILRILHGRFSSILRLIPVSAVVVHAKVLMKSYLLISNASKTGIDGSKYKKNVFLYSDLC
jgi:hypothetical protein